jgi:hypothetical protein
MMMRGMTVVDLLIERDPKKQQEKRHKRFIRRQFPALGLRRDNAVQNDAHGRCPDTRPGS